MSIDGRLPHFCNFSSGGRCWNGNNNEEMNIMRTEFDDSIENQGYYKLLLINVTNNLLILFFIDLNPVVSFNRSELVEIAQSLGNY